MRKRVFGRQLGRTKNERQALFRGLVTCLMEQGEITTTLAKAKAVRSKIEKLITKAKKGTLSDRRLLFRALNKRTLVNKLVDGIAPLFKQRNGGYLRIVRVGRKSGDNAELAKILFVEDISQQLLNKKMKSEVPEKLEEEKLEKPVKPRKAKNVKTNKKITD